MFSNDLREVLVSTTLWPLTKTLLQFIDWENLCKSRACDAASTREEKRMELTPHRKKGLHPSQRGETKGRMWEYMEKWLLTPERNILLLSNSKNIKQRLKRIIPSRSTPNTVACQRKINKIPWLTSQNYPELIRPPEKCAQTRTFSNHKLAL